MPQSVDDKLSHQSQLQITKLHKSQKGDQKGQKTDSRLKWRSDKHIRYTAHKPARAERRISSIFRKL
jgi:hypothetical protein